MKKSLVCSAAVVVAAMSVGIYFSASRLATCKGDSHLAAACVAETWDTEKVDLLPRYDPNRYVSDPSTDSIFAASIPKR